MFTALRKFAIFCHRWMGVAFCLLFTWWFVTGVFMMYCDFPSVGSADRLRHAEKLDASRIRVSPEEAYRAMGLDIPPDSVKLAMFDGRPAYWFGEVPQQTIVYADDGTVQDGYPAELNLRTAARWTKAQAGEARVEEIREPDQWTVGGQAREEGPLFKYTWPDGQQVYVSAASGQVAQYTTSASRLGAYLGPIPHWLYYTALRKNGRLWSRIVIWLSGVGTLMAISGLVVGVLVYSPSKRYRYEGEPASIPYSGTKRLHMIFGLFFGIIACTWTFSGMLSMDPFPSLVPGGGRGDAARITKALRGNEVVIAAFAPKSPVEALAAAPSILQVKEMELTSFAGQSVYLMSGILGDAKLLSSWIVPVNGIPSALFDRERVLETVRKAVGPAALAEARTVNQYEAYYSDRVFNRDGNRPLPVLYVRMPGGKAGEDSTGYYVDLHTARIVGRRAPDGWSNRWLYHGLHSLDFPWLYNHRPAWDIVMLVLLLGGTALCMTSAIIAWKLLRRKIVA
jgi:PepSY-associated TM region